MVKDIHGHISQEADAKQIHGIFDDWGVDEAVNMVDFIEIDMKKVIRQAEVSGRIYPVIMMPPQLRKGPEYLEKCIETGFKGLKLHSQIHGFKYDDPTIFPTVRKAEDLNIPVFVHTGPTWSRGPYNENMQTASTLPYVFPDVNFIFCEGDVRLARWLLKKFQNLYIDTSNFLGFQIEEITMLFEWGLEDKIVFGTDFTIQAHRTVSHHKQQHERFEVLKLDDDVKRKIFNENWKKILIQ